MTDNNLHTTAPKSPKGDFASRPPKGGENELPLQGAGGLDWVETTLGEVGKTITGKTPSTKEDSFWGGEIPFITPTDINNDSRYCIPARTISEKGKESLKTSIIPKNAICYTSIASIGLLCISKQESLTNQQINSLIVDENNDHLFFYYYLKFLTPSLKKIAGGTTTHIINKTQFENFPILLPPLPEQQVIAKILSAFDDKIELLREQNKTLEEMGQVIFQEQMQPPSPLKGEQTASQPPKGGVSEKSPLGDLGALPEGWRVGKLGEVVDLLNGFAYKSSDFIENGKYRLVTIANVQDGSFVENTKDGLDEIPQKMPDYCNLKTGDILLSLTGNVGRICHVVGKNYFLNQRVAKLQAKEKQDYGFIYTMFRQNSMIGLLESISAGTAQQNLSPIKTAELEIIIPSREILDDFANTINQMIDKMLDNKLQIQSLARSRDELLPKLMSGEVRVNDFSNN